jgi:glutaryl-CoA dehydrogenase
VTTPRTDPLELLGLSSLLSQEERDIQRAVRTMVDEHVRPHVAEWFEAGTLPARELALEFGKLGVLGMHLEGYGCAGLNPTSYGVACL